MHDEKFVLRLSEPDPGTAYLELPDHPGQGTGGCVYRQIELRDIMEDYLGPSVYLDFDKNGKLIGIEILS